MNLETFEMSRNHLPIVPSGTQVRSCSDKPVRKKTACAGTCVGCRKKTQAGGFDSTDEGSNDD